MSVPDVRRYVGVCMSCRNWQIDVRPGAVSDLGGGQPAFWAVGEASADHLRDCPGAGGRVKFGDQWVEPLRMSGGQQADGSLEMQPFPRWWVAK